uniref:BsuBI/PstI family type II restriction endonuclease n=1 Tax=unclassified Vibrio TaxID=2614977 RepID=UPI002690A420
MLQRFGCQFCEIHGLTELSDELVLLWVFASKHMVLETEYLKPLNAPPMPHDKLSDVVVYDEKRKWLFLIEAVTSHGPVSHKRWIELEDALKGYSVGLFTLQLFLIEPNLEKMLLILCGKRKFGSPIIQII